MVCTGEFFAVYDPSSNTWSTNPVHDAALVIRVGHVMVTGATRNTAYILGGVDDTAADVMDVRTPQLFLSRPC